jgi:hypothetical protein
MIILILDFLNNLHDNIFLIVVAISYVGFILKCLKNENSRKYFWLISIVFFIVARKNDFYTGYLNPDELQWIVSANSLKHDTYEYFNYYIIADFGRIFTVIPLVMISIFNESVELYHARLLNLSLYLVFLFLQFKIINLLFKNKSIAYINSSILIIVLGLPNNLMGVGTDHDFISYGKGLIFCDKLKIEF